MQFTHPTVADGRVYVGHTILPGTNQPRPETQYVDAYDAATGDRIWQTTLPKTPNTPIVTETAVLVHDGTTLYALDPTNGTQLWTHEPPHGIRQVLPIPDSTLVLSTRPDTDSTMLAVTSEGLVSWRISVPPSLAPQLAWANGRAYTATTEGVLVAIDTETKQVAWQRDLQDGEYPIPNSIVATPCAVFVAVDSVLYAVTRDGTPGWTTDPAGPELATDGTTLYSVNGDGFVRAFDVRSGKRRWEQFYGIEDFRRTDGFYESPVVGGQTIYAGTLNDKLLALSVADGSKRWGLEREWNSPASVALVENTLYTAWGRRLVAFRKSS